MAVICLDADGTIVDSLSVEAVYYVGAFQKKGYDFVKDIEDLKRLCRNNYYEECAKAGLSVTDCREIGKVYREDLKKDKVKMTLFDGTPALINELGKKAPLYIVSSNQSAFISDILAGYGVTGVTEIIGGDRETSKVNAFQLLKKRYPAEKILFAGDTKGDILEGKQAGLDLVIGVTYGWGYKTDLADADADILVDSVAALREVLEQALVTA
jgi:phosphoglycolate phosphatase